MASLTAKPPVRRSHPGAARRAVGRNLTAYGFLCGALICFAFFSWYPMIREILLSFQQTNFVDPATWVGFENFRTVIEDSAFRAPAVVVLLFKWFYDPGSGLFNQVLDFAHLPMLSWLDSTSTALISLVIVSTWMNLGTGTLIYLAALQSVPGELYESAELDGAGLFRRIWHVTVPQTRLILLVMLLLQVVATMQVFIEPYLLTGGGPENATITVAYLMYQYAFNFGDFGAGGALGLMLMVVLMVFSAIYLRVSRDNQS
jgi:multiple sugar transport system permease protein